MRELGKRSPLIALVLLMALLASVGTYQFKVSRLSLQLKALGLSAETARNELQQQVVRCNLQHGSSRILWGISCSTCLANICMEEVRLSIHRF